MDNYNELVLLTKEYASKHITDLPFHNMTHTENVVRAVREIGEAENLSEKEIQLLEISAWFHDTGYTSEDCSNHESCSASLSFDFLNNKLEEPDLEIIKGCIMATRIPQTPRNLLEQVMCDSDLSHLGTSNFNAYSEALRKEKSVVAKEGGISKSQWLVMNLHFLAEHRYFTNYARQHFQPKKAENIATIKSDLSAVMEEKKEQKEKKKKQKKELKEKNVETPLLKEKPRRDIEEMHGVLARNQLGLSSIADRKASILLSINSIITSFAIGYLFRKIEQVPELMMPSVILAITGLVSVILAVLATRPNVNKNPKKKKEEVNLLFFGDFVDLSLEEYQSLFRDKTKTPQQIYDQLAKDSYFLGKVLDIKYRKVRAAFNFFMIGITISVLSFIVTFATI
ncbi:Pycsar system effector family protein [Flammeovirga kamogawensis]|uniref:Pycsar effector protein domain-containing protein n=1 Tax=Flammeovirga kamogawensis TaxID=373891 RepID=A0ABX8H1R7_9BACT|nr:Pycsar system effector family protein [Flammeovirga kamogawensis]MBB6463281.1 putative metal-dependent HD superfamily phosphohydrolase [Flammeovirga kamogawensis]QWG09569.1 hypothetical protein KM029_23460 [Flammeovirga kamogawensis]TRX65083.1 phosphohydrolase [Flammeovirga kamogawensis]